MLKFSDKPNFSSRLTVCKNYSGETWVKYKCCLNFNCHALYCSFSMISFQKHPFKYKHEYYVKKLQKQ